MTLREFLKDRTMPVKFQFNGWGNDHYIEVIAVGDHYAFVKNPAMKDFTKPHRESLYDLDETHDPVLFIE